MPKYADGTDAKVNDHVHGKCPKGHGMAGVVMDFAATATGDMTVGHQIAGVPGKEGDSHRVNIAESVWAKDFMPTGRPLHILPKVAADAATPK